MGLEKDLIPTVSQVDKSVMQMLILHLDKQSSKLVLLYIETRLSSLLG